jgi:hypothetical protein
MPQMCKRGREEEGGKRKAEKLGALKKCECQFEAI